MDQQQLKDAIRAAYVTGATDVHDVWVNGSNHREADFGEAASDYAASIELPPPDELDRLRAENERLVKAWEAQHAEKVKEAAEAKLWFGKAQKWKDALERIATVDMGGGFLGAQACRKFARATLEPKP